MVDRNVKRIRPDDEQLSMVQDNLANALQQLLDLANNGSQAAQLSLAPLMQQARGPGTPFSVKTAALNVDGRSDGNYVNGQPTITFGDPQVTLANGVIIPQKDSQLLSYGQAIWVGSKGAADGFLIIPQVAGIVFRIPNIANTANSLTIDDSGNIVCNNITGAALGVSGVISCNSLTANQNISAGTTVSAPSVVSASGFKTVVPFGVATNLTAAANALVQTTVTTFNQAMLGGAGSNFYSLPMTHAGSIVGATLTEAGSNVGSHLLSIYKGANLTYSWTVGVVAAYVGKSTNFPKGMAQLSFVAGDVIKVYVSSSTANNINSIVSLTLEMVA